MKEFNSVEDALLNCPHIKRAQEIGGANWGKEEDLFYGKELQKVIVCNLCDSKLK